MALLGVHTRDGLLRSMHTDVSRIEERNLSPIGRRYEAGRSLRGHRYIILIMEAVINDRNLLSAEGKVNGRCCNDTGGWNLATG
jgi:hypothetical protein